MVSLGLDGDALGLVLPSDLGRLLASLIVIDLNRSMASKITKTKEVHENRLPPRHSVYHR